ncbi:MAG TPA: DbpA RNA binding domain-containing protein, partial [Opitutus sp.]|nr:DbpA RNA binding domain-containing protein [Opitutus sp.]
DEVEEARTNVFFEKIRATLEAKEFKPHDQMIDRLLDQGYASTDICSALIHMLQGTTAGADKKPAEKSAPAFAGGGAAAKSGGGKPAPAWAKPRDEAAARPAPAPAAERRAAEHQEADVAGDAEPERPKKTKYERPARTGREPGMATLFLNVGRKQLVTPADIVGKISGVTRLSAEVVGAIDIHQRHTLADVAESEAAFIVKKLTGIKLKGIALAPALAGAETHE